MQDVESTILRNLQYNAEYARKVFPFLKDEYFLRNEDKTYFQRIKKHFIEYNSLPDKATLLLDFEKLKLSEKAYNQLCDMAETLHKQREELAPDINWLLDTTEEFCKNKALFLALSEAIVISKGEDKGNLSTTAIPEILSKALAVSFDTNVGHDYLLHSDLRYMYYHTKANKIPFHLADFNKITNGGVERKTINCIAAPTGVGKSMMLCDLAANYLKMGYSVIYITLEMAEEKIAQRIDANIMNIDIGNIENIPKQLWDEKIAVIREKYTGKLIVKEYPTGSAHAGHFRYLLKELKQKQNFVPDIIIIDYLNICTSEKFKDKSNSYGFVKSICEELRGLGVSQNVALWTATQLNRDGVDNSDADMKNISESMGGPMTFDFLFGVISTEELASMGQVMIKQYKNRYADVFLNSKFNLGIDRPKMKFYDLQNASPAKSIAGSKGSNNVIRTKTSPTKQQPTKGNYSGIKP